jgi:hypothetical protein
LCSVWADQNVQKRSVYHLFCRNNCPPVSVEGRAPPLRWSRALGPSRNAANVPKTSERRPRSPLTSSIVKKTLSVNCFTQERFGDVYAS